MPSGEKNLSEYLRPGRFIDSDHPNVISFAERVAGEKISEREKAVALFYAVRDEIRYDPYRIDLHAEAMRASTALAQGYGFCVTKAMLLAAGARVHGIPSRIGFADVHNHLTTKRFREAMGTDVFAHHGFTELYLGERWVKATPTFNRSLCDRFGVAPLEFDGVHDSVFHAFDREGNRYMEYIRDRGRHADLPLEEFKRGLEAAYPRLMVNGVWSLSGRFEDDAVADQEGKE